MTAGRLVVVKQLPASLDANECNAIFQELMPHFESDRPCLVFDFFAVRSLDSLGVELLLRCVEAVMKRNGDLKLAAVSPEIAVVLEMTRVDRLFEIFRNCADAVESFHRFSAGSLLSSTRPDLVANGSLQEQEGSLDLRGDG